MTTSERDRLPDFIASPIFLIKKGKILELYTLLRGEVEKYEKGEPFIETEEEVYEALSPFEWNQKTFDSMESRLLNVIKKAIIYQYSDIDKFKLNINPIDERNIEIKQLLLLSQFYRERKLNQQFENTVNRLKTLQNTTQNTQHRQYILYLAAFEEYQYSSFYRMPDRNDKRAEVLENLDLFYIISKLSILIQEEPPIKENIEAQLENLERLTTSKNSVLARIIGLYRKAFHIIWYKEGEDETILEDYLLTLEADVHLLPIEEQKNLYTCARNFCTTQYKKGKNQYLKISFELIKKNLNSGFLYHNDGTYDGILWSAFQNIVAIGLRLGELNWVWTFMTEHRTKIIAPNKAEQERFYHFNLACYYFKKEDYNEALRLLKTDFDDERYHLIARTLEIKLYFEKRNKRDKEIDFLENRIAAFETHLSRKNVSVLDKEGYRNFIKLTKKLSRETRIQKKDLEEKNSIAEREWILEKVKMLNEKKKRNRFSFRD